MHRISISKESSPKPLDEMITISLAKEDATRYINLLKKTWPSTKIKDIRRYA